LVQDETANGDEAKRRFEKEVLEAAVTTFVFGAAEIFRGQDRQVDGAMSEQTGQQQRKALQSGEVKSERGEMFGKMVLKHIKFAHLPGHVNRVLSLFSDYQWIMLSVFVV